MPGGNRCGFRFPPGSFLSADRLRGRRDRLARAHEPRHPAPGWPAFNVSDLLEGRIIESNRIELKSGWNEKIKAATLRTVCAFANDLLNLNGGYIVLGVEEEQGRAVLSPSGLKDPDRVQREIRQACERIQPSYQPFVFPVTFKDASLVVIWAPGGDTRPYQAPEDLNVKGSSLQYYVRQGPETIQARGDRMRQLLELTAKVPFDDRRSLASLQDISISLVRRFLHQVGSDLVRQEPPIEEAQLYRRLNLLFRVNGHEVPRNVALMFFNEDPDRFFPGARIEVVQFGDEGDLLEERVFRGPLSSQVQEVLRYLDSLGGYSSARCPGRLRSSGRCPIPTRPWKRPWSTRSITAATRGRPSRSRSISIRIAWKSSATPVRSPDPSRALPARRRSSSGPGAQPPDRGLSEGAAAR